MNVTQFVVVAALCVVASTANDRNKVYSEEFAMSSAMKSGADAMRKEWQDIRMKLINEPSSDYSRLYFALEFQTFTAKLAVSTRHGDKVIAVTDTGASSVAQHIEVGETFVKYILQDFKKFQGSKDSVCLYNKSNDYVCFKNFAKGYEHGTHIRDHTEGPIAPGKKIFLTHN